MHGKDECTCAVDGTIKVRELATGIRDGKPSGKRGTMGGNGRAGVGLIVVSRGSAGTPGVPRNAGGIKCDPGGKNAAPG